MTKFTVETIFLSCVVIIVHSQLSVIHPRPYLSASHLLTANIRQLRQPDVEHLENFSDNLDREDNTALPSTTRLSISNEYGERVPVPFDTAISTFDTSIKETTKQQQKQQPATAPSRKSKNIDISTIRLVDPFKQPDPYEISPDPVLDDFNTNFGQESSLNKTERKFSTRNGVYSLKEQSFFAASEQDNTFAPSEDNTQNRQDEDSGNSNSNSGNGVGGYSDSVQPSSSNDNLEQDDNFVLSKLTSTDTRKKRLNQCVQTCIDDAFDAFKK